jgi:hypothetical protein
MAEKKKRNWVNAGPGLGTALGTGLGAASGLHGGRKAYKSAKALRGLGVAAKLKKRRALWHLLERAVTGGGAGWLVGSAPQLVRDTKRALEKKGSMSLQRRATVLHKLAAISR